MSKVPECLCPEEGLAACDWQVDITIAVHREGDEAPYRGTTQHVQRGLSVLTAAVLAARAVDGINEAMLDELGAELAACFGDNSEMVAKLSAMRK